MGGGIDVGQAVVHGHAKGVADLRSTVGLVVAHEPGQDGEARGVRGGPGLGPAMVVAQVEEGAGARGPLAALEAQREELVQVLVVGVHDEHVAVAAHRPVARRPALDPMGLRDGLVGDGIEGLAHPVALVVVLELHDLLGLARVHDHVGEAVDPHASRRDLTPEVGVQRRAAPDEGVDVLAGEGGVGGGGADVEVPPVVRGKQGQGPRQRTPKSGRPTGHGHERDGHESDGHGETELQAAPPETLISPRHDPARSARAHGCEPAHIAPRTVSATRSSSSDP